jgi:transglutaminase-like putative cysteine protease
MPSFRVRHLTTYRYEQPVALGPHRLVLRPRDGHDLRITATGLAITPQPTAIRWLHDVYSNSIAIAEFDRAAVGELVIESLVEIDHFGLDAPQFPLEPFAERWPFNYRPEQWPDLRVWTERQWADPPGQLDRWVRRFVAGGEDLPTQELLVAIMHAIRDQLPYQVREEEGIRGPLQTLAEGGSCRDFAVLMIEAVRTLGLAARFASGYLHVAAAAQAGLRGGGATHAWLQVYLPGAGWVDFDPTNALYGGKDLIRVAIARDPGTVSPVSGSFTGPAGTASALTVEVAVERLDPPPG